MLTLDVLAMVAANGGGMILDGSKFLPDGLAQIAANAAGKGSHIIVRNPGGFMPNDLARIAASGRGAVIFDFSNE